jgi:hypothetical protein
MSTTKNLQYSVSLSVDELIHLRDLFSVRLPPTFEHTVSTLLSAKLNKNQMESNLWDKLIELCKKAEIPVGDAAPDFAINLAGLPPMDIFEIAPQKNVLDENPKEQKKHETKSRKSSVRTRRSKPTC